MTNSEVLIFEPVMSQPDRFGLAVGLTHSASGVFGTGGQKQGTAWGMSVLRCVVIQAHSRGTTTVKRCWGWEEEAFEGRAKRHARMLREIILLLCYNLMGPLPFRCGVEG